jgi:hypothetical protein
MPRTTKKPDELIYQLVEAPSTQRVNCVFDFLFDALYQEKDGDDIDKLQIVDYNKEQDEQN